jgi:hypothetical protein
MDEVINRAIRTETKKKATVTYVVSERERTAEKQRDDE